MSKEREAKRLKAKSMALSNAAALIIDFYEGGADSFQDDELQNLYIKASKEIAKQLDARADKFQKKAELTGLDIDCSLEEY